LLAMTVYQSTSPPNVSPRSRASLLLQEPSIVSALLYSLLGSHASPAHLPITRLETTPLLCRSKLARDDGVSVHINAECQSAIASKLAPPTGTFDSFSPGVPPAGVVTRHRRTCRSQDSKPPRSSVGASLLAMTVYQSTSPPNVSPRSRASLLLQRIFSDRENNARSFSQWLLSDLEAE